MVLCLEEVMGQRQGGRGGQGMIPARMVCQQTLGEELPRPAGTASWPAEELGALAPSSQGGAE